MYWRRVATAFRSFRRHKVRVIPQWVPLRKASGSNSLCLVGQPVRQVGIRMASGSAQA